MTIICPYRSGLDIELRCDELRANHAIIGHHRMTVMESLSILPVRIDHKSLLITVLH